MRGLIVARVFAALLILLTVSPFTAPFAAIDLADIAGDKDTSSAASDSKLKQDLADLAFLSPAVLQPDLQSYGFIAPLVDRVDRRPILSLVLRI